jgi:hypothetical protein
MSDKDKELLIQDSKNGPNSNSIRIPNLRVQVQPAEDIAELECLNAQDS